MIVGNSIWKNTSRRLWPRYLKPAGERSPLEEQIARMVQWRLDRQFEEKPMTEKSDG